MSKSDYTIFEEYKNSVYNHIGWVKYVESDLSEFEEAKPDGCFGFLMMNFLSKMDKMGKKTMKKVHRNKKYLLNADLALSNKTIKTAICADLKGTEKLPIDITNVVTQSIYNLPPKVKANFDLNAMVVAYMCYKLSETGVENYCQN